jgi:hypothetical protein
MLTVKRCVDELPVLVEKTILIALPLLELNSRQRRFYDLHNVQAGGQAKRVQRASGCTQRIPLLSPVAKAVSSKVSHKNHPKSWLKL